MTRRNPLAIKVAAAWSALSTSDRQTHTTAFIACLFLLLPEMTRRDGGRIMGSSETRTQTKT